ncbi:MAG: M48 family metallopeptidase [Sulfurovum sp.]|uniref:YgjP-like metallopeptidase domain-containing protein n=1 Tax=Sulfurovum sp. TaxID=1969726 RepID=UPI0028681EF8|nr:YgjP-like metallopeptidase domain-containing protein [Sulfurovum sp.]MCO4845309.1 M48 family metallopeptidase [Sulfurovum sp.]
MLKYLNGYDAQLKAQVQTLIDQKKLGEYLLSRYSDIHPYSTDKSLYTYVIELKNTYMKSSLPLAKVLYDTKIRDINTALGTHTFVSRVQGGKLKAKNEIRISHVFKKVPEAFLRMIAVHELVHIKEKEHNKAFYKLCTHIEPAYHQLEFDLRLYLTYRDIFGELYV